MTIRRKDSAPNLPRKLTPTEVRAKVVEEILSTERDYVHNLENIVEVSIHACACITCMSEWDAVYAHVYVPLLPRAKKSTSLCCYIIHDIVVPDSVIVEVTSNSGSPTTRQNYHWRLSLGFDN